MVNVKSLQVIKPSLLSCGCSSNIFMPLGAVARDTIHYFIPIFRIDSFKSIISFNTELDKIISKVIYENNGWM